MAVNNVRPSGEVPSIYIEVVSEVLKSSFAVHFPVCGHPEVSKAILPRDQTRGYLRGHAKVVLLHKAPYRGATGNGDTGVVAVGIAVSLGGDISALGSVLYCRHIAPTAVRVSLLQPLAIRDGFLYSCYAVITVICVFRSRTVGRLLI